MLWDCGLTLPPRRIIYTDYYGSALYKEEEDVTMPMHPIIAQYTNDCVFLKTEATNSIE